VAQRESHLFSGNQYLGPCGRDASSKVVRRVSWVEMAMKDAHKQEYFRSRMSSKRDHTI
jgi:hypothetical protein